jgi:hypothetical protein
MDCFASLAMTMWQSSDKTIDHPTSSPKETPC